MANDVDNRSIDNGSGDRRSITDNGAEGFGQKTKQNKPKISGNKFPGPTGLESPSTSLLQYRETRILIFPVRVNWSKGHSANKPPS